MFHDPVLCLAYCGDFTFKEISAELVDELSPKSDHESDNEDLQGTGLLQNDTESDFENIYDEAADNEHSDNEQSIEKQTQVHSNQQQTQDLDNVDVKPSVLAKFKFGQETIEISSLSDNGDLPDKDKKKNGVRQ